MRIFVLVATLSLLSGRAPALEVRSTWTPRVSAFGEYAPPPSVIEGSITGTFTADEPIDLLVGDAGFVRLTASAFQRVFLWDDPVPMLAVFRAASGAVDTVWATTAPLPALEPGNPALPVVNLTLDPAALWSAETGLYVWGDSAAPNWNQEGSDWEREATLSLWDGAGQPVVQRTVGVRINGGWTRCLPQKSLRLYFDHHDDPETIVHDFFGAGPTASERLLLRETMQAEYLLNDHWATGIYRDLGHLTSRWTPVVGYLNGEYWGLYGLRERLDDKWATTTLGLDGDRIVLVKDGETDAGDPQAWPAFLAWAYAHPRPASHEFFVAVAQRLDLRSYTDWLLINASAASGENGFAHNLVLLRDPDGRWHHTMWDEDVILNWQNVNADLLRFYSAVTPSEYAEHRPPLSWFVAFEHNVPFTRLFEALMHNAEYRTLFAARADTLLAGPLSVAAAQARLDAVVAAFAPGLPDHVTRFTPSDLPQLSAQIASRRDFLAARDPIFRAQLASFRQEYLAAVELSRFSADAVAGEVSLAWRTERERDNQGFEVWRAVGDSTAMARLAGYQEHPGLVGALHSDLPREYAFVDQDCPAGVPVWYQLRHVDVTDAVVSHDWYERLGPPAPGLVINEFLASNTAVNRDEAGDYEDWIEIYNASPAAIELGGHYLSDSLADPLQWAFPDGTLPPGAHLLVWCDDEPGEGRYHATFKLSAGGEAISLVREDVGLLTTVDALTYSAQSANVSQGRRPDGADSWTFFPTPTPGAANGSAVPVADVADPGFVVRAVTPNPAGGPVTIRFAAGSARAVDVEVYDLRGRRLRRLTAAAPGGEGVVTWDRHDADGRPAPAGVYLLRLTAGTQSVTRTLSVVR